MPTHLRLVVALLCPLLPPFTRLAAQTNAPATERTNLAVLTGTVTNAATARTLGGARVYLREGNREVFTDEQGAFRLVNLAPGTQHVQSLVVLLDGPEPVERCSCCNCLVAARAKALASTLACERERPCRVVCTPTDCAILRAK